MFAQTAVITCIIGLAHSGAIQNTAHLSQYGGNHVEYGRQYGLAENLGYSVNPATAGEAVSYVNIVREISNRGPHANGAYANEINGLGGHNLGLGYYNAAGWVNSGYNGISAGLPYSGANLLTRSSGLGAYAGVPHNANLGYSAAGPAHVGAGYTGSTATGHYGGLLAHARAYGGVPISYSNVNNGPLRSTLLGNGAYGIGASAAHGSYGNAHGQTW